MADTNIVINISETGGEKVLKTIKDINSEGEKIGTTGPPALRSLAAASREAGDATDKVVRGHAGINREVLVLSHELALGNYKRFAASLIVLGEQTNALGRTFQLLAPLGVAGGVALAGVAAAAALVAFEMYRGYSQQQDYIKSLILTGNAAGQTMDSINNLAKTTAASSHLTIGAAKELNLALAQSGEVGPRLIGPLGEAFGALQKLTGETAEAAAKAAIKLAEDPVKATLELNKSLHFVTLAQFEQIRALEEAGHTEEAALVASKALAAHLAGPQAEALYHTGDLAKGVAQDFQNLIQWMQKLGQTASTGDRLAEINKQLLAIDEAGRKRASQTLGGNVFADANDKEKREKLLSEQGALNRDLLRQNEKAAADANKAQVESDAISASNRLHSLLKKAHFQENFNTELKKLKEDEAKIVADGGKVSPAEHDAAVAELKRQFGPRKTPTIRTNDNDVYRTALEEQRGFIEKEAGLYKERVLKLKDNLSLGTTTETDYIRDEAAAHITELFNDRAFVLAEEAIAVARAKASGNKQGLADKQRFKNELDKIDREIDAVQLKEVLDLNTYAKKLQAEYNTIELALNKSLSARQTAANRSRNKETMSSSDATTQSALEQNEDKYQALIAQTIEDMQKKGRTADEVAEAVRRLQDAEAKEANQITKIGDQRTTDREDWSRGWQGAFAQYQEDAANAAQQGRSVFQTASKGMEDALVSFVTTGKANFSDFAKSVIADLLRIAAKRAIAGIFDLVLGSIGGGTGAVQGYASAAGISGGRASGGDVQPGKSYVVGEKGPEVMTVGQQGGRVTTNHTSNGGDVNIGTFHIEVKGGETNDQTSAAVQKATLDAMTKIADGRIANAKRPGGLMYATA